MNMVLFFGQTEVPINRALWLLKSYKNFGSQIYVICPLDSSRNYQISTLVHNSLLVDLKVVSNSIQNGSNACSGAHNCAQICVGAPNGQYTCLASDESSDDETPIIPTNNIDHCKAQHFQCANKNCIHDQLRCNGDDNCRDNSDENVDLCAHYNFKCLSDNKLLPM